MINITEYRELILRPTLKEIGMWSRAAENLLTIIPLVESNLTHVKQLNGPALGFNQIEKFTYYDLINYLERREDLKEKILNACYLRDFPPFEALVWHLRLSICIARLKFWTRTQPLPLYDDPVGMWEQYKEIYNSSLGKAEPKRFYDLWRVHIHGYFDN